MTTEKQPPSVWRRAYYGSVRHLWVGPRLTLCGKSVVMLRDADTKQYKKCKRCQDLQLLQK